MIQQQVKGTVQGRRIVLEEDVCFQDGARVVVTLRPEAGTELSEDEKQRRAALLRSAAGGWADEAEELDRFMEWNYEQRKRDCNKGIE